MTKEKWFEHMESEGLKRPSLGGNPIAWDCAKKTHLEMQCPDCKARIKTIRANRLQKERHESMTLLGLTRIKGALGGTYYE